ncbi:MAG TPA: sugar phosphate nucleotidyltransferase [Candidatus Ozemobacteraceae bacterium]|nr:sugar phosphate nucleotidyltransferase [Candidatus Ozemobacteraceae bacterium]
MPDAPFPEDLPAAILAGGLGTRLRGCLNNLPKPLAPIHGLPFLAYLLWQLHDAGCTRAILCTGHRGDLVEATFGRRFGNVVLDYSREQTPLGTAGALRHAFPAVRADHVLVMNGDTFCHIPLQTFIQRALARPGTESLAVVPAGETASYGRILLDDAGLVRSFDEKPAAGESPGVVNAGIYLLSASLLSGLPANTAVSLEREVLPRTASERKLNGFTFSGPFLDIGVPERLAAADSFLHDLADRVAEIWKPS